VFGKGRKWVLILNHSRQPIDVTSKLQVMANFKPGDLEDGSQRLKWNCSRHLFHQSRKIESRIRTGIPRQPGGRLPS